MEKFKLPDHKLLKNKPISNQIYMYIRELIINNKATPGTALSENDLASHFNVSRQPVREALTRLSHDELIEIIPQRGTFVSKISVPDLHGICFARSSIECNAIYESLRLDHAEFSKIVKKLQNNLIKQKELLHDNMMYIHFLKLDDEFHKLICSFSGNDFAWNMLQNVRANLDRIRFFSLKHISNPEDLISIHEELLQYIENKEYFAACALLKSHVYEITHTYKRILEENREWFY